MKRISLLCMLLVILCVNTYAAAPVVSNVTASQRTDDSNIVDIYYNVSDSDTATLTICVMVSSNGGRQSYTISASSVSGDVGSSVSSGTGKHIIWNVGTTIPGAYSASYKISVIASDSAFSGQMIYITAGSFLMGNNSIDNDAVYSNSSELPQHPISLSGYWIGKYEVTRGEYRQFMNAGGYSNSSYWSTAGWTWKGTRMEPDYWAANQDWGTGIFTQTDNHPVVGVNYYESEAFCNWAGGHLPTEAQWERAARWTGSSPNVYPWGNTWDQQKCNNENDSLYPRCQTAPVGSYSSLSGCQDMAGNVREWCQDWYLSRYYLLSPSSDPPGPASGVSRVLRGGGWNDSVNYSRCAYRYSNYPYDNLNSSGFRLAR